jgi:hypothetical protein
MEADLNLLIKLKFALENGQDEVAKSTAEMLVKEQVVMQFPELKESDPILYRQVVEITIPMVLERLRNKLNHERAMAS